MTIIQPSELHFKDIPVYLKYISDNGFDRISSTIKLLWGTTEIRDYFYYLIVSDRDEPRMGFPLDIFDCLLKLAVLSEKTLTEFVTSV